MTKLREPCCLAAARWSESPPINTAAAPAPQACSWLSPGLRRLLFCRAFKSWLVIKMSGALDSAEQTALSSAVQLNVPSLSVTVGHTDPLRARAWPRAAALALLAVQPIRVILALPLGRQCLSCWGQA